MRRRSLNSSRTPTAPKRRTKVLPAGVHKIPQNQKSHLSLGSSLEVKVPRMQRVLQRNRVQDMSRCRSKAPFISRGPSQNKKILNLKKSILRIMKAKNPLRSQVRVTNSNKSLMSKTQDNPTWKKLKKKKFLKLWDTFQWGANCIGWTARQQYCGCLMTSEKKTQCTLSLKSNNSWRRSLLKSWSPKSCTSSPFGWCKMKPRSSCRKT